MPQKMKGGKHISLSCKTSSMCSEFSPLKSMEAILILMIFVSFRVTFYWGSEFNTLSFACRIALNISDQYWISQPYTVVAVDTGRAVFRGMLVAMFILKPKDSSAGCLHVNVIFVLNVIRENKESTRQRFQLAVCWPHQVGAEVNQMQLREESHFWNGSWLPLLDLSVSHMGPQSFPQIHWKLSRILRSNLYPADPHSTRCPL